MANLLKLVIAILVALSCHVSALEALKAPEEILIDGINTEESWQLATWQPIDQLILGTMPSKDDFSGRFKVMWDEEQLYLLVEITDDILFDQHGNPFDHYWDDDCLEVFIDEDGSGGNHQYNFNAFAYHVALDNQAVDIGGKNADDSANFVLLNDHVTSVWRHSETSPNNIIWELSIRVFDDTFSPNKSNQQAVKLMQGKKLGFMVAYCDNDGSKIREHFMNSVDINPVKGNKNLGYITADVFSAMTLVESRK